MTIKFQEKKSQQKDYHMNHILLTEVFQNQCKTCHPTDISGGA